MTDPKPFKPSSQWAKDRTILEGTIGPRIAKEIRKLRGNRALNQIVKETGLARPNYSRVECARHTVSLGTFVLLIQRMGGDPVEILRKVLTDTHEAASSTAMEKAMELFAQGKRIEAFKVFYAEMNAIGHITGLAEAKNLVDAEATKRGLRA